MHFDRHILDWHLRNLNFCNVQTPSRLTPSSAFPVRLLQHARHVRSLPHTSGPSERRTQRSNGRISLRFPNPIA